MENRIKGSRGRAALLLAGVLALVLAACAASPRAWRDITQVREGMTEPEVVAVMGKPDRRDETPQGTMLVWGGRDGGGATLTAGRVTLVMSSTFDVIAPLRLRSPEPILARCGTVPFSWADVRRVRNGMTEAEAVRIIGPPCSRVQSGRFVTLSWIYVDSNGGTSGASMTFEDGMAIDAPGAAEPASPGQPSQVTAPPFVER